MKVKKWTNPTNCATYNSWKAMRARCLNPLHAAYHNYGGRGVSICDRWESYDNFVFDMGFAPAKCSLDRIDNAKGYFAANCKWSTVKEQLNNQRRNVRLTLNGRTQTAAQWAEELGLHAGTILKRIQKYGCDAESALKVGRLKEWRHGTRTGYEKGCRCDACRSAHAKRFRDIRARQKLQVICTASECDPTRRPGACSPETPSPAQPSCVWPDEEEQPGT